MREIHYKMHRTIIRRVWIVSFLDQFIFSSYRGAVISGFSSAEIS